MKLNDTIKRLDTKTQRYGAPIVLTTPELVKYHSELAKEGIKYLVIHAPKELGCEACSA